MPGGEPPLAFDALGLGTVGPWRGWWSLYPQSDGTKITIDDAKALAGLPLLVVFVLFQRQIIRGVAHTGLAGQ